MLNLGRFCQKVHFQIEVDKHQCNRCQRKAHLFNLLGLTDQLSQERMSLQLMSKLAVVRGIRQFFFKTNALYFNKLTYFYEAVLLCGRAVANRKVLNFSLFRPFCRQTIIWGEREEKFDHISPTLKELKFLLVPESFRI